MIDIDILEMMEKAATPGPWVPMHDNRICRERHELGYCTYDIVEGTSQGDAVFKDGNAQFIAFARNIVPELITEVRWLRKELALFCMNDSPLPVSEEEYRRLRRIEDAAKEVAANEAEDIDSRLRYVSVQPGRDEWAALKAALCNRTE